VSEEKIGHVQNAVQATASGRTMQKRQILANTPTKIQTTAVLFDAKGAFTFLTEAHAIHYAFGSVDAIWVDLQTGESVLLTPGASWNQVDFIKAKRIRSFNGAADAGVTVYITYGDAIITGVPPSSTFTVSAELEVIDETTGLPEVLTGTTLLLGLAGGTVKSLYSASHTLGTDTVSGLTVPIGEELQFDTSGNNAPGLSTSSHTMGFDPLTGTGQIIGAMDTSNLSPAAPSLFTVPPNLVASASIGAGTPVSTVGGQMAVVQVFASDSGTVQFIDGTSNLLYMYPPDGSAPFLTLDNTYAIPPGAPYYYFYLNIGATHEIIPTATGGTGAWEFNINQGPQFTQPLPAKSF